MTQKPKTTSQPAKAAPKEHPPSYDLPDKLEAHAKSILGSEAANVCNQSADFIRELISIRTDLSVRLTRAEKIIQAIHDRAASL